MLFRVLRTAKATLSRTFYLDEVATDATGSVSVSVTRLDGTLVQGPVNATGPDASHTYSFTFSGLDVVDHLIVTWSATVGGDAILLDQDEIEVVGGFFVGLSEIRGIDPKLSDTNRYTTQDLISKRTWVEDEFERITGQAFVPRFAREVLTGDGCSYVLRLGWPRLRKVRSVTIEGVAMDQATVNSIGPNLVGLAKLPSLWPYPAGLTSGNIVIEYEHGMDRVPVGINEVAKLRIKSRLFTSQSPLPDRAERIATTEVGLVTLAIAKGDATGIPEVDAELDRHPSPRPKWG